MGDSVYKIITSSLTISQMKRMLTYNSYSFLSCFWITSVFVRLCSFDNVCEWKHHTIRAMFKCVWTMRLDCLSERLIKLTNEAIVYLSFIWNCSTHRTICCTVCKEAPKTYRKQRYNSMIAIISSMHNKSLNTDVTICVEWKAINLPPSFQASMICRVLLKI